MAFKFKRIFLIVADSVGIGAEPDAEKYGDAGSNTFLHISQGVNGLNIPTLNAMGINDLAPIMGTTKVKHPHSYATTSREESNGKDTMTGHWEMMGIYTEKPFQTFTDTGFPPELISELEKMGLVEKENELDGTYKVLTAFHYLEDLINSITIAEEVQDEIPE